MTDRLLGCFAKAVREKKELTEAELSSAYTEFMNHLQSITDGGQPVIVKLRRLRRLELELETYRHRAFPVLEGLTDIYLTKPPPWSGWRRTCYISWRSIPGSMPRRHLPMKRQGTVPPSTGKAPWQT